MKTFIPFIPLVVGLAVQAYFLPWLFVAQIIFLIIFVAIKN